MPYGLTRKQIGELSHEIGMRLMIDPDKIEGALDGITRQEVARIARNEKEEAENGKKCT